LLIVWWRDIISDLFFCPAFYGFLSAGLFLPSHNGCRDPGACRSTVTGISAVMLLGLLLAYCDKEQQYYFTPGGKCASSFIIAPLITIGSILLVEGSRIILPSSVTIELRLCALDRAAESLAKVLAQPAETLQRWMSDARYADAYLIITRSQEAYVDALGAMPPGSLQRIEQALRHSPEFTWFRPAGCGRLHPPGEIA
jgi:hypothetical protein